MIKEFKLGYEYAITMLMSRQMPQNVIVHPEQRLSIDLAEEMRKRTVDGSYKGVWFCVANEAKRHRITAMIQKAMGLIPGVSDFVFVWRTRDGLGVLFLELKAGKNTQTEAQGYFQQWCQHWELPYAISWTLEDSIRELTEIGAFAG